MELLRTTSLHLTTGRMFKIYCQRTTQTTSSPFSSSNNCLRIAVTILSTFILYRMNALREFAWRQVVCQTKFIVNCHISEKDFFLPRISCIDVLVLRYKGIFSPWYINNEPHFESLYVSMRLLLILFSPLSLLQIVEISASYGIFLQTHPLNQHNTYNHIFYHQTLQRGVTKTPKNHRQVRKIAIKMGLCLIEKYKAWKMEKLRQRLLDEAYSRRNERRRRSEGEHRQEGQRRYESRRYRSPARPGTAPYGPRRGQLRNPFDTDSDEHLPSWIDRAYDHHEDEYNIQSSRRSKRTVTEPTVRYRSANRAMPDIASPYPRRFDSLPRREGPLNYHPRHGHRYLREDEHMPQEVLEWVQPLSSGRRGEWEVRGHRGRLFGQGPPPPLPPKKVRTPQWVGYPPPGWF